MPLDTDTAPAFQPTIYKLETSRYAEYRRKLFIRMGIVIPLLSAGFFYLMWHFDRERSAFRFVFIPVLMAWLVYRQFKQQQNNCRIWYSSFKGAN